MNSTWDLSILDSWRGLIKGISSGLINLSGFNPEEYEYYDHPMHGDMHVMVPGKFIAFKGVCACVCVHMPPMVSTCLGWSDVGGRGGIQPRHFSTSRLDVEKCLGCMRYIYCSCVRVCLCLP